MMNENIYAKKANLLFLTVVILALFANLFVSLLSIKDIAIPIVLNLLVSQLIILIPGLIFFLNLSKDGGFPGIYGKIRFVSIPLLIVFTWLVMPLVMAANVFSQIFTKNEVMSISDSVLDMPMIPIVLIMGIIGPFCEEFVFRGIINSCFVKSSERYILSGVVSGLFFGLMHMNFNQFCYAFVLGIIFALINEVLESTWPAFICHAVVNTQNVIMLYAMNAFMEKTAGTGLFEAYDSMMNEQSGAPQYTKVFIIIMFIGLLLVSFASMILAGLLLYGICSLEGKKDRFRLVFKKTNALPRKRVLYPTGIIGIVLCIFVMFLLESVIKLLK